VKAFEEYQFDLSLASHEGVARELIDKEGDDFRAFIDALLSSHGITGLEWDARNSYGDDADAEDMLTPKYEGKREFNLS
jgi:hypothetical protein